MLLVAKNIISDSNLFFYLYNFSQSTTFEYNSIFDYYDFNRNIGFFLLNPDYGNKEGVYPNKVKLTPLDIRHNLLVNMTKEIPPLAREFYIYKEFYENNQNLLVKNYGIKWREA